MNNYQKIFTSKSLLINYLKEEKIFLKKNLGQNFLIDRNIINKILSCVPFSGNHVVEIGAGIGNISVFYYKDTLKTYLVEIDKGFFKFLKQVFKNENHIFVINHDFLKINLKNLLNYDKKYIFFSNLPYSICSQILIRFLDFYDIIKEVYVMVPEIYRENFFSKDNIYKNRLGNLLNLFFNIKVLFRVNKNSFFPIPEIDSMFIGMYPKILAKEEMYAFIEKSKKILSILYKTKRKKLRRVFEENFQNSIKFKSFYERRVDELSLMEIRRIIERAELV